MQIRNEQVVRMLLFLVSNISYGCLHKGWRLSGLEQTFVSSSGNVWEISTAKNYFGRWSSIGIQPVAAHSPLVSAPSSYWESVWGSHGKVGASLVLSVQWGLKQLDKAPCCFPDLSFSVWGWQGEQWGAPAPTEWGKVVGLPMWQRRSFSPEQHFKDGSCSPTHWTVGIGLCKCYVAGSFSSTWHLKVGFHNPSPPPTQKWREQWGKASRQPLVWERDGEHCPGSFLQKVFSQKGHVSPRSKQMNTCMLVISTGGRSILLVEMQCLYEASIFTY